MNYWIIKSEPFKYSWQQMQEDGSTYWDGVRSYAARIFLNEMKKGDLCLFYHSNEGKEIVGITRVIKESYQDPTTDDERWVAVDVEAVCSLNEPVTLAQLKADDLLKDIVSRHNADCFAVLVDHGSHVAMSTVKFVEHGCHACAPRYVDHTLCVVFEVFGGNVG